MMTYSNTITDKSDTIFGGQNLPNNGVLYVHKDKVIDTQYSFNGNHITEKDVYLMKDVDAGFNAYFLTDTLQLNADTENAYLSVKGSDGQGLNSLHA